MAGNLTEPYTGDVDTGLTRFKVSAGSVHTTEHFHDVALGIVPGATTWNKFGYNADVDTAATEVVACFGGTFSPLTTASTLSIVSDDVADDSAGTGAQSVFITGIDANRDIQTELVTMDGTTPVVTTTTWLGINRMVIYVAGSSAYNVGNITATAVTGGAVQAKIPATEGTTQQCIFFVPNNYDFIADYIVLNILRLASQDPKVTIKGIVFAALSNARYEVFRNQIDTGVENTVQITPSQPFPIGENQVFWLEATTDKDNTEVSARFSGILHLKED